MSAQVQRLQRQNVALARYPRAICILVLIPGSTALTCARPDAYNLAMAAVVAAWTVLCDWKYRQAVKTWREGDDDD